jgi:hypothetical protein
MADATSVGVGVDQGLDGDLIYSGEQVLDGDVRFHDGLFRKQGTELNGWLPTSVAALAMRLLGSC